MKAILFCTFALCIAGTAFAIKCLSCPKGPTCNEVQKNCHGGEGRCISVNGTVNGVRLYYKDCVFAPRCDKCKEFINATDCNAHCCYEPEYCNSEPVNATAVPIALPSSTQQPVGSTTDGPTPTSSNTTVTTNATTPGVTSATPTAHAGIASVDILALFFLSVLGFLGKLI